MKVCNEKCKISNNIFVDQRVLEYSTAFHRGLQKLWVHELKVKLGLKAVLRRLMPNYNFRET